MTKHRSSGRSRTQIFMLMVGIAAGLTVAGCGDSDTTPVLQADPVQAVSAPTTSLGLVDQRTGPQGLSSEVMAGRDPENPTDYRLGPNDRLRIIVFGQERLTSEYVLDGTGALAFPLIGQIPATGKTSKELERELTNKLDPDFVRNASVSVEILTRRPFFVVGEVQKAGSYPHYAGLNVLNAVATAGGFTYRARKDTFYLKRTDRDGKLYRVRATAETTVRPGDIIEVNERFF